jgi:phytoene desaturase
MMPGIYRQAFQAMGKRMEDELNLNRIDPVYKVKFSGDRQVLYTTDMASMQEQFEEIEKGSYSKFLKLMSKGFFIYENSMRLIDRNYFRILDPTLIKYPFLLLRYKAFNNHYRYISKYFKSEELRALFTFQNLYLGQNPYGASGMYTFLPFMELADGVYFPEGGMHEVAVKLLDLAKEAGVGTHLNSPVDRIDVNKNKVSGVVLEDGSFHPADLVISNADLPYVYQKLLPDNRKAKRLARKKYSCSAIAFHWGVDKVYPQLKQHTVFVSENHRESCRIIFKENSFSDDPSIYVHSPVRSDKSAAPENQDSLTAIVHAGNLEDSKEYDWEQIKSQARKAILSRFEQEGLTDFEKHIKFEICFTPQSWYDEFNLVKGGTFGSLAHNLFQMGFLRPANHHKKYTNLYFTGGSTQPGSGMPLSILSAKLVLERIERDNGNTITKS